jgi:hypothetical protein
MDGLWQRCAAWVFTITAFLYWLFEIRPMAPDQEMAILLARTLGMYTAAQAALLILSARLSSAIDPGGGLSLMMEDAECENACPHRVEFRQEGVLTGLDDGLLSIENDMLVFRGLTSSFQIAAKDVPEVSSLPKRLKPRPEAGKDLNRVFVLTSAGHIELRINLRTGFEGYEIRVLSMRFQKAIAKWMRERPEADGASILPPARVHPDIERTGFHRYTELVSSVVLVVMNISIAISPPAQLTMSTSAGLLSILQVGGAGALALFSLRLAWMHYTDMTIRGSLSEMPASPQA